MSVYLQGLRLSCSRLESSPIGGADCFIRFCWLNLYTSQSTLRYLKGIKKGITIFGLYYLIKNIISKYFLKLVVTLACQKTYIHCVCRYLSSPLIVRKVYLELKSYYKVNVGVHKANIQPWWSIFTSFKEKHKQILGNQYILTFV